MARGIIEWVGLVATLTLAVPIAFMGVDFVVSGRPLGWAFLVVAVAAVVVEQYAARPGDLPGSIAKRAADAVTKDPGED